MGILPSPPEVFDHSKEPLVYPVKNVNLFLFGQENMSESHVLL
jgi:hypothetical protein